MKAWKKFAKTATIFSGPWKLNKGFRRALVQEDWMNLSMTSEFCGVLVTLVPFYSFFLVAALETNSL